LSLNKFPEQQTLSPFSRELPRTGREYNGKVAKNGVKPRAIFYRGGFQVNLTKRANSYNFARTANGTVRASSGSTAMDGSLPLSIGGMS